MYKSKKVIIIYMLGLFMLCTLAAISSAQPYPTGMEWAGACFLWILFCFVVWILIAIWVYRDAEKRGGSGALWLIIVLFTWIIGLIIWLVVRPPIGEIKKEETQERRCPGCGRIIPYRPPDMPLLWQEI